MQESVVLVFVVGEKIIDIDNDVYWTYLIKGSYLWTLSFDKKSSEKLMSMQCKTEKSFCTIPNT